MANTGQEQQTTTRKTPDLQWFWTVMGWDATTPYLYPVRRRRKEGLIALAILRTFQNCWRRRGPVLRYGVVS